MLWYSLEAPHRGASNEYPQNIMFIWRTGENYSRQISPITAPLQVGLVGLLNHQTASDDS